MPREKTFRFVTDMSPSANDHPAGESASQSSAAPRRCHSSWTMASVGAEKSHVPLVATDPSVKSGAGVFSHVERVEHVDAPRGGSFVPDFCA